MRAFWLAAALGAVLLAACERQAAAPDPLVEAEAACAHADGQSRIEACTALIETGALEPQRRAAAYAARAAAKEDGGDVTGALRDYEAALRDDGQSAAALLGRGDILLKSGQLDAALAMAERAAEVDASGRAQQLLGRIALRRGDFDAALAHLDAAIAIDSNLAGAHAARARVRKANGDIDGARADYSAAIRVDGALAEARAGRCRLNLEANSDLDLAHSDAAAAVLADPRNVEAHICRGILQLRDSEPGDALASFSAALQVEPGNPEALFGHGIARMRTGDSQGARDMNRARDFSSHIGQRYEQLGVGTW